jgi:hypothetical protein
MTLRAKTPRAISRPCQEEETFFTALRISQPQSSCIYTSIVVFEDIPYVSWPV